MANKRNTGGNTIPGSVIEFIRERIEFRGWGQRATLKEASKRFGFRQQDMLAAWKAYQEKRG